MCQTEWRSELATAPWDSKGLTGFRAQCPHPELPFWVSRCFQKAVCWEPMLRGSQEHLPTQLLPRSLCPLEVGNDLSHPPPLPFCPCLLVQLP